MRELSHLLIVKPTHNGSPNIWYGGSANTAHHTPVGLPYLGGLFIYCAKLLLKTIYSRMITQDFLVGMIIMRQRTLIGFGSYEIINKLIGGGCYLGFIDVPSIVSTL